MHWAWCSEEETEGQGVWSRGDGEQNGQKVVCEESTGGIVEALRQRWECGFSSDTTGMPVEGCQQDRRGVIGAFEIISLAILQEGTVGAGSEAGRPGRSLLLQREMTVP